MSKKPPKPPKGADTGPVRKGAGQKPKGNPKLKTGRPGAGRFVSS